MYVSAVEKIQQQQILFVTLRLFCVKLRPVVNNERRPIRVEKKMFFLAVRAVKDSDIEEGMWDIPTLKNPQ